MSRRNNPKQWRKDRCMEPVEFQPLDETNPIVMRLRANEKVKLQITKHLSSMNEADLQAVLWMIEAWKAEHGND